MKRYTLLPVIFMMILFTHYAVLSGERENKLQNQPSGGSRFFSGTSSVTIPFEMNRGHIILKIEVSSKNSI